MKSRNRARVISSRRRYRTRSRGVQWRFFVPLSSALSSANEFCTSSGVSRISISATCRVSRLSGAVSSTNDDSSSMVDMLSLGYLLGDVVPGVWDRAVTTVVWSGTRARWTAAAGPRPVCVYGADATGVRRVQKPTQVRRSAAALAGPLVGSGWRVPKNGGKTRLRERAG